MRSKRFIYLIRKTESCSYIYNEQILSKTPLTSFATAQCLLCFCARIDGLILTLQDAPMCRVNVCLSPHTRVCVSISECGCVSVCVCVCNCHPFCPAFSPSHMKAKVLSARPRLHSRHMRSSDKRRRPPKRALSLSISRSHSFSSSLVICEHVCV